MKIQVNDIVKILTGKDKGKQAKVMSVLPRRQMVVVEGINLVTRHRKPQNGQSGERIILTKPMHVSKVGILNAAGEVDRVGYKILKDGSKIRIYKKSGEEIVNTVKPEVKKTSKPNEKVTKTNKAKK